MATQTPRKTPTTSTEKRPPQSQPQQQRSNEPSAEEISRRAYELYQARGGDHGRDQNDWFQAENELKLGRQ
jgi:hypothetical protein